MKKLYICLILSFLLLPSAALAQRGSSPNYFSKSGNVVSPKGNASFAVGNPTCTGDNCVEGDLEVTGSLRLGPAAQTANYLDAAGTLLLTFDNTTGWVNYGSTGTTTFAAETVIKKEGAGSLKFGQADGSGTRTVAFYKNIGSTDLSGSDDFSIWAYLPNGKLKTNTVGVYFATDNTFANYKLFTLGGGTTGTGVTGWNCWQFKKADVAGSGGTFDWTDTEVILVKWDTISSVDTVYLDSLYVGRTAKPKVILSLDDGYNGPATVSGVTYANTQGIPLTFYVIKDYSSNPETYTDYLTTNQLQDYYANGNDIAIHHQTNLTTLALSAAQSAVTECQRWLIDSGMPRAAQHLAWPNGGHNSGLTTFSRNLGVKTAASIQGQPITSYNFQNHVLGIGNQWILNRMPTNGNNIATLQAAVDEAITDGTTLFLYLHTIGGGADITSADWQTLCDYIKTKVDAGLIDAVTISQWWDEMRTRYGTPVVLGP